MNLGGGGQYPQQGPRKLLKQRVFHKDGPQMTSTPYQSYNPPPPPGFSVTPQPADEWGYDANPQYQSANTYPAYNAPPAQFQPQAQPQQAYGQPQFMMPQQQPMYPSMIPPGYTDIISNPLVTNVMREYGENIMKSAGDQVRDQVLGKVGGLKYYFAVDTRYVMLKLKLLLFPFLHKDWGVQYEQDQPVQPRYELNAPDLYIPTMAYVTYILLAGLVLGIQNRFSPEKLGMHATTATLWTGGELGAEYIMLYLANIQTNLKFWDLLAYAGYKYVGIIVAILIGQMFQWTGYLVCISYCALALAFFMMRSLKSRVMESPVSQMYNDPASPPPPVGTTRRMYFLVLVALAQPLLMLYLSYHLIRSSVADPSVQSAPL
uniref:Protein YIF1 n=1 Tax=Cacopsylla melanoneura TaxID=428564 RepID=A0A8D8LSA0_9HEMI